MLKIGLQYFAEEPSAAAKTTINIEMNLKNASGGYDTLYPSTVASQVSGTFADSQIPNLAASKITSGTFNSARIPSLDTSKITTGTFADARIPSLAASKITSGTFDTARIPTLAASKISEGTFSGTKTGEYVFPGNVRIGGTGSSSNAKLRIGDGEYVFFHEDTDDCLTIKAKRIEFTTTQSPGLTNNGVQIGNSSSNEGLVYKIGNRVGNGTNTFSFSTGLTKILILAYGENNSQSNPYPSSYNMGDNGYYPYGPARNFWTYNIPNNEGSSLGFADNTISGMTWRNIIGYSITFNSGTISISTSGTPTNSSSTNYDRVNDSGYYYYWFVIGY